MPIDEKYMKMINSKVADIKNIGGRYAGAITAAEFIHYLLRTFRGLISILLALQSQVQKAMLTTVGHRVMGLDW